MDIYVAVILMIFPTLGVPAELMAKRYQYPGSATPESVGIATVYDVPLPENVSAIRRWSVLTVCVEVPSLTSENFATVPLVPTARVPPSPTDDATVVISGLGLRVPSVFSR